MNIIGRTRTATQRRLTRRFCGICRQFRLPIAFWNRQFCAKKSFLAKVSVISTKMAQLYRSPSTAMPSTRNGVPPKQANPENVLGKHATPAVRRRSSVILVFQSVHSARSLDANASSTRRTSFFSPGCCHANMSVDHVLELASPALCHQGPPRHRQAFRTTCHKSMLLVGVRRRLQTWRAKNLL